MLTRSCKKLFKTKSKKKASTIVNKIYKKTNETIWFYILLQSDLLSLKQLCFTNKMTFRICNHFYYWQLKFNQHDLPILTPGHDMISWINEYENIYYKSLTINQLLKLFQIEKQQHPLNCIHIQCYFNLNSDISTVLPRKLQHMIRNIILNKNMNLQIINMKLYDPLPCIDYTIYDNNGEKIDTYGSIETDEREIVKLLIKILYFFPDPKMIIHMNTLILITMKTPILIKN